VSGLTTAEKLVRVNVILIVVLSALLIVCLVRQLWMPAGVFSLLIFSNVLQLVTRRRQDGRETGTSR
jgi:hypothetical protein